MVIQEGEEKEKEKEEAWFLKLLETHFRNCAFCLKIHSKTMNICTVANHSLQMT